MKTVHNHTNKEMITTLTMLTLSLELCALNVFQGLQTTFKGILLSGVLSSASAIIWPCSGYLVSAAWYFSGVDGWFKVLDINFKLLESS